MPGGSLGWGDIGRTGRTMVGRQTAGGILDRPPPSPGEG